MKLFKQWLCVQAIVVLIIIAGTAAQTWGPNTKSLVIACIVLAVIGVILALVLLDRITKDEDKR